MVFIRYILFGEMLYCSAMKRIVILAILGIICLSATPATPHSQIISIETLPAIEQMMEEADENTLILWDVDQTLLTPDDPILKPKWEKLLDQLIGGKKFLVDETGEKRYVFREILINAPMSLVDEGSPALLRRLQSRGVPIIAFTAAPGGKIGKVENFVDWRIDELRRFGFDFSEAFPDFPVLVLPKDPDLEFPPVYKAGVLVTSLHDKGPVLLDFFKEMHWKPARIIFIDDQMSNIQSVMESMQGEIPVLSIHYTGASRLPCELDEKMARSQVEHFLKTGEWLTENRG